MSTINLTEATFAEAVRRPGIVLVDFWATWCPPCRMFAPVFEKTSQAHPDITFAKVDTDAEQKLAAGADIRSIPTLTAFRDGVLLFNQAGALSGPALEQLISRLREAGPGATRPTISAEAGARSPAGHAGVRGATPSVADPPVGWAPWTRWPSSVSGGWAAAWPPGS